MDPKYVVWSLGQARPRLCSIVKRGAAPVIALTVLLSIQGCSFEQSSPLPPAPSTIATTSNPTETAAPVDAACPPRYYQTATTVTESPGDPTLGSDRLFAPTDTGPRDRATGTTTIGPGNIPITYTVAPDDLRENVAERFCLPEHYFEALNQVRTNVSATLYAGDILNLNPYMITAVGDQNGTVSVNPLPTPAPPQQQATPTP